MSTRLENALPVDVHDLRSDRFGRSQVLDQRGALLRVEVGEGGPPLSAAPRVDLLDRQPHTAQGVSRESEIDAARSVGAVGLDGAPRAPGLGVDVVDVASPNAMISP